MNVLVAVAVFIFASPELFDWTALAVMASGLTFAVASACVFNNVADRELDAHMERTKKRGLVTGEVTPLHALIYAGALIICGVLLLKLVHPLALAAALLGFVTYVFIYTPLKPKTGYALYVGAIAGATPTLVGYAAAAQRLDGVAYALFVILFLWQLPHFLAIARYRFDEYMAGGVPLLVKRPQNDKEKQKARKIFYWSLVFLLLFCLTLIVQRWIT